MEKPTGEIINKKNITLEMALALFIKNTNENFQVMQNIINDYEKRISTLESEIEILKENV